MDCIFCNKPVTENSIEHIVPESLGNQHYILEIGSICRKCNNSFSDFEEKALTKTMLGFERSRMGIQTKKGKAAKAKSHNIQFTGDAAFRKNFIKISGFTEDDIEEISQDGTFKVRILDFDKSDMATSKLMLKIGLESLYQSQRKIYKQHDFKELRDHLTKINNTEWPILTVKNPANVFQSAPRFLDKKKLKDFRCEILFHTTIDGEVILLFKYTILNYLVNLTNRGTAWVLPFLESDPYALLYPEHVRLRLNKKLALAEKKY